MSREYFPGMGKAVADRTINRSGEVWNDVAYRVALGNSLLDQKRNDLPALRHHLSQATTLMSGRHLQHGDHEQPFRPMEVFSNCSTAMLRFLEFKLLLSGSGVGSAYDEDLMAYDITQMPNVVQVIRADHPDVLAGRVVGYPTREEAEARIRPGATIHYHNVADSREGWAKGVEQVERHAFMRRTDDYLIIEYSDVRELGAPIKGMQNRPASGPGPLMDAIRNVATLRLNGMEPWEAAMWADHYLAECVLVGGARRAARIAIKHWLDKSIFKFIDIKRPREFIGKSMDEIIEMRKTGSYQSRLWSANNSVAVDAEFYRCLADYEAGATYPKAVHAGLVWGAVMAAQYGDGTGEPGFLNVHKLTVNKEGLDRYLTEPFAGSDLYQPDEETDELMRHITKLVLDHRYQFIVNPCGEIVLFLLGAFCVIADMVPYHAKNDEEVIKSCRVVTRALMRVNTMPSIYGLEVERTNRIGIGLTGIHEWMWARFGLSFRDAIEEGGIGKFGITTKAANFWNFLLKMGWVIDDEARVYAAELGVAVPHTNKTIKPAGTTSKLFGLTEGAHLPAMRKYLRWVQFRNDDPLVAQYAARGYPTRKLKTYEGTTIVGFPTAPVITTLGLDEKLVTAPEATPAEQFRWLRLLEHYWLGKDHGNQISYTLKYDPKVVPFDEFRQLMRDNVESVRAVSVMPEAANTYEYLPEQPIRDEEYDELVAFIQAMEEDVDRVHVDCASGACPINFEKVA